MLNCDTLIELPSNEKYKILIVEDTEFINNSVLKTLSRFHYSCDQAFTVKEATDKVKLKEYDFVLLDLNLPDGSGLKLLDETEYLTKAKIIILTAETDVEQREDLFKNGILDYIVKDKYFNSGVSDISKTIKELELNKNSNILVVDDSSFLQTYIGKLLGVRNYNIIHAISAEVGLEKLESHHVNLIILDMQLPGINGLELLKRIRKNKNFSDIPVIMLSGSSTAELVRDSLKAGASDFIHKPFNAEELILKADIEIKSDRRNRDILCRQQILNDYKDAVDRSSIVSKTNTKGIITFVNDKFCDISGYKIEELVGKNHNMVRHPDMPKSTFEEMWKTIEDKKPWFGKVKNKTKDGGYYWVNTVINPIVDYDGNIVEYIGIRTDITELENIKSELETNLNISNDNFSEAYKISQEYQRAIDESNILSRADTKGKITYANNKFCEISGYSKEELIGQSHSLVKHPDNPKELYLDLWKTITDGKVWHGQLKNRAKDGSTYNVESTIIPIIDNNENITEYLAIRHDVTDIVNMHTEMENTQKEIIHKMGEVGESRSKETGFHVKRVAEYSRTLALLAGLSTEKAELLYSASPMHDIGKVAIPDSILKKPGKLDDDEWIVMRSHAKIGYNILKESKRPILKAAAMVSYSHHEKWDGSGYPNAIVGEKIHIYGRITAIADVFDALGSDRCYKKAWDDERIFNLFEEEKGKHFDPKLADLFLDNKEKFIAIRDKYKDVI
ncbi:response regulator receiver (CheY-like & PAS domain) modulated metal dependent phosphohydrolase [Sulfurimonas gotlandica GD1]|uniref:Response regulator receiver (CheY-like & PAS domain) modulated metal dependent phosphohydrolase n=1 Tax=Sulfurimonas gotlandica (strain DSM 19862 / JCM 16533 / GD1) TaxID=929558 RepID=B6BJ10_SULGG|nr:response regulator [Sulfurimonas gotlandica]EDZ63765.1 metal-dependent phosphohydrolase, HD subdomain [Sulfurimonas gotlandica GD1]EHP30525.1 response regulator receiver (CheY-like & PAS domain) modulated metal dependent phosphohydrolase [Sulfurimonas gotlandica GD1]